MTVIYLSCTSTNSVNPLYLIINKMNGYSVECNGNKYLKLVPTDKSIKILKYYKELWNKSEILLDQ